MGARRLSDLARFDVALFSGAVPGEAPEVGPVVDVEDDLSAGRPRDPHRPELCSGRIGACEMGSADQNRARALDVGRVDVGLVERAVGAIVAIKDQRKGLLVADAEQDERGQPGRIGVDSCDVDPFPSALLADEAAHMLVADPGDQATS